MQTNLLLLGLWAVAAAVAQSQFPKQSEKFFLQIKSDNDTLNNNYLFACHAGAALEGLCIGGSNAPDENDVSSVFYHNTSETWSLDGNEIGYVMWDLPINQGNDTAWVPSPMSLTYIPTTNVAIPEFILSSYGVTTMFDSDDKLAIISSFDDSKFTADGPPTPKDIAWYNWYACHTYVGGYYYHAVTWTMAGEPHNPTCEPVDVIRLFG